jgi:histidinol-phosphate aminotransferase
LKIAPSALVFGNGSGELVMFLLSVFARPPAGRERAAVLYPVPSFVFYRNAALASGLEPIELPLAEDFALDEGALEAAVSEHRPNLAFFARPNNPTGTLWERVAIARCARSHPDLIVVVDEAYIDYGGDTMLDEIDALPNLMVLRTLSKLGLAALRVGYLAAHESVAHQVEKVRPPYNVGALNQHAAAWLLERHGGLLRDRCREVVSERNRLASALAGIPHVKVFDSRANLLLVRVGEAGDGLAKDTWRALAERGVLVRRFGGVDSLRGCLRITVGRPRENQALLDALAEVLT